MPTDTERREAALRLRDEAAHGEMHIRDFLGALCACIKTGRNEYRALLRLADLIEPSYKPDAEYEAWYNSLSHFGDERGGPSTIRQLIEEIAWAALTVDLGPNGNTDSTGVDEGRVYTDRLFAEWEREALRLSGSINRYELLEEVKELEKCAWYFGLDFDEDEPLRDRLKEASEDFAGSARRIREALGTSDD